LAEAASLRLMILAALSVLFCHSLLASLLYQQYWIFAGFLMPGALLSLAVSLGLAAAAHRMAGGPTLVEEGERIGSPMFAAAVATGTLPLFMLMLFEAGAGVFYTAMAALCLAAWVLARPKFQARVEPVTNGLLTGALMFVVALVMSAFLPAVTGERISALDLALCMAPASGMQLDPFLMLWVVAIPEELWARVFLVSVLAPTFGARAAAFTSQLLFTWLHVPSRVMSLGGSAWMAILVIGVNSLILLYGYLKHAHTPLYSVVAHMTYNSLLSMLFYNLAGAVTVLVFILVIALILREKAVGVEVLGVRL